MTSSIINNPKANLIGSVWMVVAMAIFAVEDTLIKAVSATLPLGQILIIFGLSGAFLFACYLRLNKEPLFVSDVLSLPMRIRAISETLGRIFFMLALSLIPLSTTTVILQATPIVVVAGSALLFGDKVGWRRWSAIFLGLIGVLVIIQPGTDGFSVFSILAVIGMFGFAARDLASHAAPATISTSILGLYGFLAVVVSGICISFWQETYFVQPDIKDSIYLLGAVFVGITAYSCLMKAMRTGQVSAVAPFRYTRLIFGVTLGVLWFGEKLSVSMIFGSGLIVASGLFILWRGKQVNQPQ